MVSSCFLLFAYLFVSSNYVVSAQGPTAIAQFNSTQDTLRTVVSYDPVLMRCSINNLPLTEQVASVQWSIMGEDGENSLPTGIRATDQNLAIQSFDPIPHTGNYSCRVTTSSGITYTSNELQLRPKSPKIFSISNPVEVVKNTRVELNCIVRSPPGNYQIRWFKGGIRRQMTNGYEPYIINNFMESDEVRYACSILHSGGNDDEAEFDVFIVDPPTFSTAPNTITLNKQQSLELSCNPTSNSKTFSFIWKFNGNLITPSSRIQIANEPKSSTLEVTGLMFSDEGNYTCEASNIAGRAVQTYPVKVQGSPEILSSGGTLEMVVLTSTILDCQYVARPPATSVVWTRDGQEISSDRVLANNSLPLNNVTQNTSGNYSCTVMTSSAGTDSITYQITVIGFPLQPTNLRHNISSQDSRSVLISWNIPPLDPQKRLDGFKLELWTNQHNQKHQQNFEIQPNVSSKQFNDLLPGEVYHAHLQSYNRAGTSEAVTTMFNLPVTAPKLELNIIALEGGRSLAVRWELLYDGGPDVKQFSLNVYMVREISEMVHSVSPSLDAQEHIVTGLQPTTRYMVCVTIANSVKQASLNQTITTFAAPPSQPSVSITMVTTNRIHLSFSILEGSSPVSQFLLNITANDAAKEVQKVIKRDSQEVAVTSEGEELHVTLVVLDLQPFTRYSFEVAAESNIGTGEFSLPTDTAKLKDGRIVYFIIIGVVGGVVLVVLIVVITIVIMVKRSKAAQKRKRTFSINSGNTKVPVSFEFQSPPHWKSSRKGSMSSRGLQSPTGSSMRDLPAVLIMDINHMSPASHDNRTSSCEKLHRTRADSLASDTYSCSVGVADHRLSVCQSEPGITHYRRSPVSEFSHSQLHGSTGKVVISGLNPTHFRHQLPLAEPSSYENNNTYDYLSPTEEDRQNSFNRSPSADKHVPLLHQNSVDQRTAQLLTLPQGAFSSSAPMINMRLSRESMLECPHSECMTDV